MTSLHDFLTCPECSGIIQGLGDSIYYPCKQCDCSREPSNWKKDVGADRSELDWEFITCCSECGEELEVDLTKYQSITGPPTCYECPRCSDTSVPRPNIMSWVVNGIKRLKGKLQFTDHVIPPHLQEGYYSHSGGGVCPNAFADMLRSSDYETSGRMIEMKEMTSRITKGHGCNCHLEVAQTDRYVVTHRNGCTE